MEYTASVEAVRDETPDVKLIRLKIDDSFDFKAGQYVLVYIPTEDHNTPYSIATTQDDLKKSGCIELCIKRVENGAASGYMHSLQLGDKVQIIGPVGQFILNEKSANDAIFLATGTGISPLRSMIRRAFEISFDKDILLFFGAKAQNDIIWRKEFEFFEKLHDNFYYIPVLSRDKWTAEMGHVQDALLKNIPDLRNKDFYIAGVKPMVEEVEELLHKFGVPSANIHTEKFV